MKFRKVAFSILLLSFGLLSFEMKNEINKCLISFTNASNLTAAAPERLPETSEKVRKVKTENGEVEVTRMDGYRVQYNNSKGVSFINLKIELSEPNSYENDKKRVIDNLKYLNAHSSGMETKELVEFKINGYKILGLSRGTIETGSTLGIFAIFPSDGVTVYFYFNNLKPEVRNFESVEDYKKQRDKFFDEYTKHLTTCKSK